MIQCVQVTQVDSNHVGNLTAESFKVRYVGKNSADYSSCKATSVF